jgi:cytochrome c peroxidase
MTRPWILAILLFALAPAAARAGLPWPPSPSPIAAYARAQAIADLGRALFFDPTLSASGRMACATCHDPAHAFAAANVRPVQSVGPDLRRQGTRAVPSLMYTQATPPFTEHFHDSDEEGDESVDQGPTGGRTWDGRVDGARDQAAIPLLASNEMANASPAAVVAKVARAPYAPEFRRLYGANIFAKPVQAFAAITKALEFYQQTPAIFSPFSSKYDAVLRGTAQLTGQEARGLALFNDPETGNCAQCHKSAVTADGRPPLFTDFGYVALGLPRNPAIPANSDPVYHDLGLCGPQRHDLSGHDAYCGMFKAPTLRNVALKQSFYHNGVFHTLREAVAFYAERDTSPARWYPTTPDGTVQKYNDLPPAYQANVSMEKPFGSKPLLSQADVDDIVAFLNTLTDGSHIGPR